MILTFFLSLTPTVFLRTILRPQQGDVKRPAGGTVSGPTRPDQSTIAAARPEPSLIPL